MSKRARVGAAPYDGPYDGLVHRLPAELRTRVYFTTTERWRAAARRIQRRMRVYWSRFGRILINAVTGGTIIDLT